MTGAQRRTADILARSGVVLAVPGAAFAVTETFCAGGTCNFRAPLSDTTGFHCFRSVEFELQWPAILHGESTSAAEKSHLVIPRPLEAWRFWGLVLYSQEERGLTAGLGPSSSGTKQRGSKPCGNHSRSGRRRRSCSRRCCWSPGSTRRCRILPSREDLRHDKALLSPQRTNFRNYQEGTIKGTKSNVTRIGCKTWCESISS